MNYFFSETPLYGVIVSILLFIKDERKFKKYNKNMIEEMKKDLEEEIDFWNKKCEKKNSMKESLFFLCNKFDVQIFFEMEDSFFRYGNGDSFFIKYCQKFLFFSNSPALFKLPPGVNSLKKPFFKMNDVLSLYSIEKNIKKSFYIQ